MIEDPTKVTFPTTENEHAHSEFKNTKDILKDSKERKILHTKEN